MMGGRRNLPQENGKAAWEKGHLERILVGISKRATSIVIEIELGRAQWLMPVSNPSYSVG